MGKSKREGEKKEKKKKEKKKEKREGRGGREKKKKKEKKNDNNTGGMTEQGTRWLTQRPMEMLVRDDRARCRTTQCQKRVPSVKGIQ